MRSCPPRSTCAAPTCSSSSWTSRSTRSSPPRRSTGSPTTSGCSPGSTRRCGRAGGWSRSAGATGTSPRSSGRGLDVAGEEPYARYFSDWTTDWEFATPQDTERRLRAAGFPDVWCWLSRVDVDPGDPAAYLRAICLGSFLPRLPEELREPFVAAALERLPDPLVIHYVRLNILARA